MHQVSSKILFNIEISSTYFKMELDCPEIASKAIPGQFIMVRVSNQWDPFLRRPFSIHRIRRSGDKGRGTGRDAHIDILYKVAGKGTEIMSEMREGDEIDVLGPVGNGYIIDSNPGTVILVGGGIGVAPLLSLAEEIISQYGKLKSILLFLGGKGRDDILCVEDFKGLGIDVRVATEDGSLGYRGVVTNILSDYIDSGDYTQGRSILCFACGPESMLREVAKITFEKKIQCQISLETRMACGLGACLGCVVKTGDKIRGRESAIDYRRVCMEGPVFDSNDVIWE